MSKITVYFTNGMNIEFTECDDDCVKSVKEWLNQDKVRTFGVNSFNIGRETIIRKENVLFVDITKKKWI